MQRLGLCCLFIEAPIRFRTATARHLSRLAQQGKKPLKHLEALILGNLESLLEAVGFCSRHGIDSFRILSGLLPLYTHPEWGYRIEELEACREILASFQAVKKRAGEKRIRLTFHPDQFVVLNSPNEGVVKRSLAELEYHGLMAEALGADVINIHAGGGYGDKPAALKRFVKEFGRLSERVRRRLTVENDDRVFTPEELLPLCRELALPLVYDVHHHRCLPDRMSVEEATQKALESWGREPLFHLSSPKEGWKAVNPRLHSDLIDPEDLPVEWAGIDPLTVDIEAKAKEVAVLKLARELKERGWNLPDRGRSI